MRIRAAITVAAFCFLTTCAAPAQERLTADEVLRWFPAGNYEKVEHCDWQRIAAAEALPVYKECCLGRSGDWLRMRPAPPSMKEAVRSYTNARLVFIKISKTEYEEVKGEDGKIYQRPKRPEGKTSYMVAYFLIKEVGYSFLSWGNSLEVFRFDILDPLIAEAVKKGELEATGESLFNQPVYAFKYKDFMGNETGYLAWPSPTQELLVAEGGLERLRSMVEAGMGQAGNMLDEDDFAPLALLIPDLGQSWSFTRFTTYKEARLSKMRELGEDQEKIELSEEELEKGDQYWIQDLAVGEQLVERSIFVYGDEDWAERALKTRTGPQDPEAHFSEYNLLRQREQKWERKDNSLIGALVYTEEFVEQRAAIMEAARKQREAEQAEREAEKETEKK